MNKVLLFDFDGTLADSFENFLTTVNILLVKNGLPQFTKKQLEESRSEDARTLIKKLKIPFYKIPFLARDMKTMQEEKISQIKIFKGLPEVLRKLKETGYILGILTSNGEDNVKLFLKNNNIDIFDYIYSDAGLFGKDKLIRKLLKENSISKEDALYIGDEIRDIQACKNVGIKIVSVSWGFNSKEGLAKHEPDYLIDSPEDLLILLKDK